ncbi:glycosyltransferase involved in cell wall biosynthesis [Pseudomonas sp. 3296]|uniref:glycosyltransferase family 4 protein n=1 Tax=Pseudomonas sp. 3296 TaxID=2817753 RepID=UPI00285798E1|nr:glycosyltransferase family 4 protein [Pseudomonas sp. 3296]MDR6917754.1 glycosyltransferase involved in cell wall biosynthesis [Pseudomonas sp. 3296]
MQANELKIARVSTVPFFVVTQLRAQIEALSASGMAVTVIASRDEMSDELTESKSFTYIPVNIEREINPIKDFLSLITLISTFRKNKFDIVHSTTPKAGLLCAIAGVFSGTKIRLHTFTGQPWATMSGVKRTILKTCDKIIGLLNTHCYADSESQKKFLVSCGIIKAEKISVIGAGSLAGIDLNRFDPSRYSSEKLSVLRADLGIPESAKVLLFVGRITPDKGIKELVSAFGEIVSKDNNIFLVLVGPFESVGEDIVRQVKDVNIRKNIKKVGYSDEPEKYMALADLLCLPSYREGFGTVVIEAAAMGTPTIGTDIYGLTDAIVDGETGVLVPVRDAVALEKAILSTLSNAPLMSAMGAAARDRARNDFGANNCSDLLINEYKGFSN